MSYFNRTKLTDSTGAVINPVTDESVFLLRKIVDLLAASATTDFRLRQRVVVEAIGTNTGVPTEINASLPVASTAVASTVNMGQVVVGFGGQATAAANIIDSRFSMIDSARNAYANGIRSKLNWS